MRYIAELERKVQALETEATSSMIQLILWKRETNAQTAEISELKLRLQTMEQRVHFQEALDDALKEEIQQVKVRIGQDIANAGPMMNFPTSMGSNQQLNSNNNHDMHVLSTAQQLQQLQILSHKQQQQLQLAGDMKLRSSGSSAKDDHSSESKRD
ncbi:hypothetical protein K7X08_027769 [Anisodus acutangulus]|uniref:Uncharacterized protein n=1 Tax=Anisodus acutangulus TaxID=402998 RepID=A0A9Q1LJR6_9SOLA|nr:hypothetical protein K7X08_027769 [Anisodus acutangulus]